MATCTPRHVQMRPRPPQPTTTSMISDSSSNWGSRRDTSQAPSMFFYTFFILIPLILFMDRLWLHIHHDASKRDHDHLNTVPSTTLMMSTSTSTSNWGSRRDASRAPGMFNYLFLFHSTNTTTDDRRPQPQPLTHPTRHNEGPTSVYRRLGSTRYFFFFLSA